MEQAVKETVEKAFWDVLQEKLSEDPPNYSHAIVLIEDVKEVMMVHINGASSQLQPCYRTDRGCQRGNDGSHQWGILPTTAMLSY